ncbi:MAG: PEP/pyruvate-binding domain-containing protein [Actinobacteria bacterium]|nr:PEP/pyruvate-binding domain-containing protein [Actinomycetota bacterium]MBO0834731.1 PEP/pyruvate-binding domain-containing protein [Actinomycetota bacterium]
MTGAAQTPADLVCPLSAVGANDRAVAGGKGASLGELHRAGLPVPPGFIVTVRAFGDAMRIADPDGTAGTELARLPAADPTAIERAAAAVRARITAAPLRTDIAAEITAAYKSLGSDVPVAVRSSAIGEDAAEASFAGLQDTYLWIRGASAVLDHVRKCWASLYNTEAVSYRLRQGMPEGDVAMAVVVQRMVDPRSAGVMFTCSPQTGDRSVIAIEGSWGLGSVLVSGEVTPDSFVVSKVTGEILRRTVAAKQRLHRANTLGTGTTAVDVDLALQEQPCLDDAEIRALAQLGRQVEQHYGVPQDIEWAITSDQIVLLQSRAETVWSGRAAEPLATPKARPMDHVFEKLSQVTRVTEP